MEIKTGDDELKLVLKPKRSLLDLEKLFLEEIKRKDCSARDLQRKYKLKDAFMAMSIIQKLQADNKRIHSYWRQYKDGKQHPSNESIYTWKTLTIQ